MPICESCYAGHCCGHCSCCPATPRQVADIERRTRRTLALLDIYIGVLASLARRADPGLPVETVTVTGGLL